MTPLDNQRSDVPVTQTPLDYAQSGVRHDGPQAGEAGVVSDVAFWTLHPVGGLRVLHVSVR